MQPITKLSGEQERLDLGNGDLGCRSPVARLGPADIPITGGSHETPTRRAGAPVEADRTERVLPCCMVVLIVPRCSPSAHARLGRGTSTRRYPLGSNISRSSEICGKRGIRSTLRCIPSSSNNWVSRRRRSGDPNLRCFKRSTRTNPRSGTSWTFLPSNARYVESTRFSSQMPQSNRIPSPGTPLWMHINAWGVFETHIGSGNPYGSQSHLTTLASASWPTLADTPVLTRKPSKSSLVS